MPDTEHNHVVRPGLQRGELLTGHCGRRSGRRRFARTWLLVIGVGCADVPDNLFTVLEPRQKPQERESSLTPEGQSDASMGSAVVADVPGGEQADASPLKPNSVSPIGPRPSTPGATDGGQSVSGQRDAGATQQASDAPLSPYDRPPSDRPLDDGTCPTGCARGGGRCEWGVCVFDCDGTENCTSEQSVCPPGADCTVRCGDGSCTENVVCRDGATCDIECVGAGSCPKEIICEGTCRVTCSGEGACAGGVGGSVTELDLRCSGLRSCGQDVRCEGQSCLIDCSGGESCQRVISYGLTNSVSCSGVGSCGSRLQCSGGNCQVVCSEQACLSGIQCGALECSVDGSTTPSYDD